jgi:hypothetical protein
MVVMVVVEVVHAELAQCQGIQLIAFHLVQDGFNAIGQTRRIVGGGEEPASQGEEVVDSAALFSTDFEITLVRWGTREIKSMEIRTEFIFLGVVDQPSVRQHLQETICVNGLSFGRRKFGTVKQVSRKVTVRP